MTAATQNNRQHTPFYWHLMKYEGVTQSAVLVYGYLLGWQNSAKAPNSKVKKVFPSLDRIGDDLGMNSKTASRSVAILEKLGFLITERPNLRKSNVYTVVELDDLPTIAPAAKPKETEPEPQEFNQPTEQGPAEMQGDIDEHANDSPVQNDECEGDLHQSSGDQDQVANDCYVVGNPVDIPDVEPVTALEWLDAAFTPHGELIPEAVQYCRKYGVTDPKEQKEYVRKLVNPDYVRDKPIYNPTPATASEPEDLPF